MHAQQVISMVAPHVLLLSSSYHARTVERCENALATVHLQRCHCWPASRAFLVAVLHVVVHLRYIGACAASRSRAAVVCGLLCIPEQRHAFCCAE